MEVTMVIKTYPKNYSAQGAFGLIKRALLLLALACIGPTAAQAQSPGLFAPAPNFAVGQPALDAHSADLTGPFQGSTGEAIALLGTNDVVQAALVKQPDGTQTNGLWNMGLLRFNKTTGNRVAWPNPTPAYARFNNQYLIFPNTPNAVIGAISKVLVRGSTILVLVESVFNDRKVVQILRFSTSGQYLGSTEVFSNGPDLYLSAGSMALYSSGFTGDDGGVQLVVVGSRQFGQTVTPAFRRFQLDENLGTLTPRTGVVAINFPICSSALACRAHSIAFGFRGLISKPTIYITGNASFASPNRQVIAVARVDSDGVRDGSWNPNNRVISNFESGRFPEQATPVGIAARTSGFGLPNSPFVDQVFVAMAVKRFCQPGVSVARIDDDQEFSTTTRIFGGSTSTSNACILGGADAYEPRGLAFDGERIYVSGQQSSTALVVVQDIARSSFVSVVGRADMGLESLQKFSYPFGAPYERASALNDIVLDNGELLGTGEVRYPSTAVFNLANKRLSARVRLVSDKLLADGFE